MLKKLTIKDWLLLTLVGAVISLGFFTRSQSRKLELSELDKKQAVIQERNRVLKEQKQILEDRLKGLKPKIAIELKDEELLKFWNQRLKSEK